MFSVSSRHHYKSASLRKTLQMPLGNCYRIWCNMLQDDLTEKKCEFIYNNQKNSWIEIRSSRTGWRFDSCVRQKELLHPCCFVFDLWDYAYSFVVIPGFFFLFSFALMKQSSQVFLGTSTTSYKRFLQAISNTPWLLLFWHMTSQTQQYVVFMLRNWKVNTLSNSRMFCGKFTGNNRSTFLGKLNISYLKMAQ